MVPGSPGGSGTIGLGRSHDPSVYSAAMTSEAGNRSLRARLAPTGTSRERASMTDSTKGGKRAAARGSAAPSGSRATSRAADGDPTQPDAAPAPTSLIQDDPLSALLDEAQAAVSEGAN